MFCFACWCVGAFVLFHEPWAVGVRGCFFLVVHVPGGWLMLWVMLVSQLSWSWSLSLLSPPLCLFCVRPANVGKFSSQRGQLRRPAGAQCSGVGGYLFCLRPYLLDLASACSA